MLTPEARRSAQEVVSEIQDHLEDEYGAHVDDVDMQYRAGVHVNIDFFIPNHSLPEYDD